MRVRVSTLRRFVRKALREQAEGHQGRDFDHAPGQSSDADMARTQLKNIAARASKLHSSLKDDDDLPAWVLSKMAVADSYMTSLSDYLHGEIDRAQEDPEYSSEYDYGDEDSMDDMGSDDMEGALSSMLGGMEMGMEDSMDYDDEESEDEDDEDHLDRVASFETGYDFAVDDMDDDDDDDMEGYGDPETPEDEEDEEDDDDDDGDAEGYGDPEMPEEDDD